MSKQRDTFNYDREKRRQAQHIASLEKHSGTLHNELRECAQLRAQVNELDLELDTLAKNPPSPYDCLRFQLTNWGTELKTKREEEQRRIEALQSCGSTDNTAINIYSERMRSIDKDIAALAKIYARIPPNIQEQKDENEKPTSWFSLLCVLGRIKDDNQLFGLVDNKHPLDLRNSIVAAYKARDLRTYCQLVVSFLIIAAKITSLKADNVISHKLWRRVQQEIESEERRTI